MGLLRRIARHRKQSGADHDMDVVEYLYLVVFHLSRTAKNDPQPPVATGRKRLILLKKSVPSRFARAKPKKRSIEAWLREIWSSSALALAQISTSVAHFCGQKLQKEFFNRIG